MRILVLGGLGKQGRVITEDLIKQSPLYQVSIVDNIMSNDLPKGLHKYFVKDLTEYETLVSLMQDTDLVVCALPSTLGYNCVKAAVEIGVNMVDLSFTDKDLSEFDQEAKDKNLSIIVDAGVAPGLSNLVAGRAMLKNPNSIDIMVGGVAQDRNAPLNGYTITWSLDDLMEEYVRPARILVDGKVKTVDALSGTELVRLQEGDFYGDTAALEAFYTDGLRSLLVNNGGVPNLSEKTMRWPGHVNAIKEHLRTGKQTLKNYMKKVCKENDPDVLVMIIRTDSQDVLTYTESDENMSAMARTTALSCATFASLVASGKLTKTGVLPPEKISEDDDVYKFVLDKMFDHGVKFTPTKYPFI